MAPTGRLNPPAGGPDPGRRAPLRVRLVLAALLLVPLLELVGIILVADWIGGWPTFLLLVLAGGLGLLLVGRAGRRAWQALRTDVREGVVPGRTVGDPVLVLLGGLMLAFPGFLTDLLGLVLVIPWTRPVARAGFRSTFARRMPPGVVPGRSVPGMGPRGPGYDRHGSDVIEGEIIAEQPPPEEPRS